VAATFGNGVSSGCIVNMGAQVTSVMCIEEGVAIPTTRSVLSFGGDDITRCLLWVQQQRQTWPHIDSDPLHDPLDFQTLNNLKETHCLMRVSGVFMIWNIVIKDVPLLSCLPLFSSHYLCYNVSSLARLYEK
jgi:actin-related protein 8